MMGTRQRGQQRQLQYSAALWQDHNLPFGFFTMPLYQTQGQAEGPVMMPHVAGLLGWHVPLTA